MKTQKEWDKRFIKVAELISEWSTCLNPERHVGAVIVKNNRILTTGYNGAPSGITNCQEKGECHKCMKAITMPGRQEDCFAVHAEQNAIAQAAKLGISVEGATLYCNLSACSVCAKSMINAGIKRVVYKRLYTDSFGLKMMQEAGIVLEKVEDDENDN